MVTFESDNWDAWHSALTSYEERVRSLGGDELSGLDNFVFRELPIAIRARAGTGSGNGADVYPGGYITKKELEKVVKWKLARGKWRPRLQSMAAAHTDESVQDASGKAFAALAESDLEGALRELTVLKGVGPATASAVLTAHSPHLAPFMSDEALAAALGGVKDYTPKKYLEFAKSMQGKAKALEASAKDGISLLVNELEKALWASAAEVAQRIKRKGTNVPTNAKKKRKTK